MKLHNSILCAAMAAFMSVMPAFSQNRSSYFLEGSYDRYRMNPALTPERSYLYIPVLGGFSLQAQSGVGLSNFLYESTSYPGKLTTFMSPDVSASEFLDGIPDVSKLGADFNVDLLGFGFGKSNWFAWLDCRLKSSTALSMPKSMFSFMKAGLSSDKYSIKDINMTSTNWLEVSLGYQFEPVKNLRVGLQANVLEGLAYAKAAIDNIDADLTSNTWTVAAQGGVQFYAPTTRLVMEDGQISDVETGVSDVKPQLNLGATVNLGAQYDMEDLVPGLKLSASVADLGVVACSWKDVQNFKTQPKTVEFAGFMESDDEDALDDLGDDFSDMFEFEEKSPETVKTTSNPTLHLGVEYAMPFAKWMSIGELVTMGMNESDFKEYMTSLNINAGKKIELAGNVAFSNLGTSYGGILNIHGAATSLFIAADCSSLRLNPQYIPIDKISTSISMGIRVCLSSLRY